MKVKVKILNDYRGVLTNEAYYKAGEYELADDVAQALIDAGRAVAVEKTKPARKTRAK